MTGPLGILAGSGDLPRRLIAASRGRQRDVFILAVDGQTDRETVDGCAHGWFRIGAVGAMFDALHKAGVRDLVMAGKFVRPSLFSLAPDARGAALLARIGFRALGDDGMLKLLTAELESEGFRVVSVADVLGNQSIGKGPLGQHAPNEKDDYDIERGMAVLHALAPVDVGQACVVQQGTVLAVEAAEGTDAMVERAALLQRGGERGVLVKLAKVQQDDRLDLPVIGADTVRKVASAGFAGIAIDGNRAILVDRDATIAAADAAGIFLVGV
ncbi:LpxI family protein [Lacibacterium aquatile]|uniref:LpxI family protein n=1 Tax=Lacibacterium aquatile TaxID=1168082 RepID=A0ABW5DJI3_9PROT